MEINNVEDIKYAFFGSPKFAAVILETLIAAKIPPALIICNPDKPVGRKKVLTAPATKLLAQKYSIPYFQPERLSADAAKLAGDWDFFLVAAYAKIIPKEILLKPKLGTLGVHPSLLPKYRGATPLQSVLLAGEFVSGTTIFLLDEKVDHGPILAQERITLSDGENYGTLSDKLAKLSGELLMKIVPDYVAGKIQPREQNHAEATFTKKFITEDGFVNLVKDEAVLIDRKIRALNPDPGVYTLINKKGEKLRLKLLASRLSPDGKLEILSAQLEGKKPTNDSRAIAEIIKKIA